jgi:hypothetical protein
LLVENDRYAYIRSTSEESVLVVLDRGTGGALEIEVDDIPLRDGLRFRSFSEGGADVTVSGGKLQISNLDRINIYLASHQSPLGAQ